MTQSFNLREVEKRFKKVMTYAPVMLGNDAVNFFKDSFKKQGWLGNSFEPWKPRKTVTKWGKTKRNKGRAILVDTGRLRRSIRLIKASNLTAVIGTDVPYARAHNEGVRLGEIQQVKAHERFTYKKQRLVKPSKVMAHVRNINQNIPQRQFMGNSPYLTKQLQRRLTAELMKSLR